MRSHRQPHIRTANGSCSLEPSRHYAGNRESLPVEENVLADYVRIRSEVALPHAIREHYNSGGAGSVFVRTESAAKRGLHAQYIEVVAGNELGIEGLRLTVNGHADACSGEHQHLRE